MNTAQEIADRSMQLATDFLDSARQEVLEMSGGSFETLRHAADLVRDRAKTGPAMAHSAEHLAFSLITAANASLLDQQGRLPH